MSVMPVPYKYYLRGNPTGTSLRYYYIDSNGDVADTTTPTELPSLPDGWEGLELVWERGFTYYGLFTNYTTPLKFNKGNAKIIRHLLYNYGVQASCELVIEKFNPESGVFDYEDYFAEMLDFSTLQDEKDYVTVGIMEGGFPAKLKARESNEFIIDLWNHPNVEWMLNDGIPLQAKLLFKTFSYSFPTLVDSFSLCPQIAYIDTEGTNFSMKFFDIDSTSTSTNFILESNGVSTDCKFSVNGVFTSYLSVSASSGDFCVGILMVDSTGTVLSRNEIYRHPTAQSSSSTQTYTINANDTFTLPAGCGAILCCYYRHHTTNSLINFTTSWSLNSSISEVNVYFENRYEPKYIPVLKAKHIYNELINKISDNDVTITAASDLLDTLDVYLTSGDGLKFLYNCVITTSLSDFFKFINTHFGASLYFDKVTQTIYLEHKESVYDYTSTIPITINSVNNVSIKPFTQDAFAEIKIGQKSFTNNDTSQYLEVTNGKDEFNLELGFTTPFTRITNKSDYISPYRADIYGIELVRINMDGKEFADYKSDNEVFAFHLDPDDTNTYTFDIPIILGGVSTSTINYHLLYREPILAGTWEINNIYSPETVYNVLFSPKRMMLNNGTYFKSIFYFNQNDDFVYTSSAKFKALAQYFETIENGTTTIAERDDQNIGELCTDGTELFIPIVVEFETIEPINVYSLIRDYPYYALEFIYNNISYWGFILGVSSKPVIRGKSKFKLLLTRDNNPQDLIR